MGSLNVAPAKGLSGKSVSISWHMLVDLLTVYDIVAMVASGELARYLYLIVYKGIDASPLEYAGLMLMATVLFQFVARERGLYSITRMESLTSQLFLAIYVSVVTFA